MSLQRADPGPARFRIGRRDVGDGAPCLIIAEVGLGHDGSLGQAHAYIDAIADTGADAVKFQTHIASAESTLREGFRVATFPQDGSRYEYWERTAFTPEQWSGLKEHADRCGVEFLSSPFSCAAVRLLRRLGVPAWKIGSGETNNLMLLEEVARGGEPVLLSTGMSYWSEIDMAVQLVRAAGSPLAVMQCTTRYPCPPEQLGLNLIADYAQRYRLPVGLSDHSGQAAPGLAAVTLGAKLLEVHVTWHKKSFGPDVAASLTLEQLAELVSGVRLLERAFSSPVDKNAGTELLGDMRDLFTKGLVARELLLPGTRLEVAHLEAKKPCAGIPAVDFHGVLGRTTLRRIEADEFITWDDLEPASP